jgi:carbon monoxide dehydrogenase subunit G
MQIEDTFRVALPVDATWRLLLDIERIAPCLPGAQLQEIEGDEYRGVVKVKVGPITAQYKGAARFESVDDAAHVATIAASGRDTRGQGNASATIKVALLPDDDGTRVDIETDLSITGKVAQFGRGVLADVSGKLLAQFVENLERDVLSGAEVDLAEAEREIEEELDVADRETPEPEEVGEAEEQAEREAPPAVRTVEHREVEAVDLLAVGGTPVLKRLAPLLFAVGGFLVVRWWLRRRSRRRA